MTCEHSRRDFLRLAGGMAAAVAFGPGCSGGGSDPQAAAERPTDKKRSTLRIAQQSHFVPAYDDWFDNEYVKRWGEEHDVDVVVDHFPINELALRADAEVTAQKGHDLFFTVTPRPIYEDDVIDHREIVEEVTAKLGPMTPHVGRSVRNPKTGKYFAFPDFWSAAVVHYRVDLWDRVEPGLRPRTWDDVLKAGGPLRALGHPVGIGFSAGDNDSELQLVTLLQAFGARIQDEDGHLDLNTAAAIEAVKFGMELFRTGMTDEVLSWDASGNNRLLATGRGSLILNVVSALRAVEQQDRALAAKVLLAPAPIGPAGDVPRCVYAIGSWTIWKFAQEPELAQQFVRDLALGCREAVIRSGFYNLPAFPGAAPDLAAILAADPEADPAGKYSLLADAAAWHTAIGHPDHHNAAVDEIVNRSLIARMFAAAAQGRMTAGEAVAAAEAEMEPIFAGWRERGKI